MGRFTSQSHMSYRTNVNGIIYRFVAVFEQITRQNSLESSAGHITIVRKNSKGTK